MSKGKMLGVDIGGSGIKGAIVDMATGQMLSERFRVETPSPSKPKNVAKAFAKVVQHFDWKEEVGCGFPAIIKNGHSLSASNVDKEWLNAPVEKLLSKACGQKVYVRNDADLAGLAEVRFGVGKDVGGVIMLITIGTGLGSAIFIDGKLVPNTELGHLYLEGQKKIAERYAADSARKNQNLSWDKWGERFNEYLNHINFLFSPNLIILGGGASKKMAKYEDKIKVKTEVKPASLQNNAGIIGAACLAYEKINAKAMV